MDNRILPNRTNTRSFGKMIRLPFKLQDFSNNLLVTKFKTTYVVMLTLEDGITNTRLGAISTDVSHVTTLSPSRNLPGVAPPAPQIQIIYKRSHLF